MVLEHKLPEGFVAPGEAQKMILNGTAPEGLWTSGLQFRDEETEIRLPKGLRVQQLQVSGCAAFKALPDGLRAESVHITDCPNFEVVPESARTTIMYFDHCPALREVRARVGCLRVFSCANFRVHEQFDCKELSVWNGQMESVPSGVAPRAALRLVNARELRRLADQDVLTLDLSGCERLQFLPNFLRAHQLTLRGCTNLQWQAWADVEVKRLDLRGCLHLHFFPQWFRVLRSVDVANTGLRKMPWHWSQCVILWNGVAVNEKIAFRPEEIQGEEILREWNSERRRVMLERVGWERFCAEVQPKVIHRDRDPGGERTLLEILFDNASEPAVVLSVQCPSTGRKYFIRVPPTRRTCHAAAAWIAGFENEEQYEPEIET